MKKFLAVVLSIVMLLCVVPFNAFAAEKTIDSPASAYAEYDRAKVGANDADYIASMSYDQIAGVLLDWVDRKIAKAAADFDNFEVEVLGQQIAVDLEIKSLDDVLSYAGYLTELGGDFANLNTEKLTGLSRANGDINFIYAVLQFMADNADVFGKVFQWESGKTFDYGKVGEYIETLPADDEVRVFYNDYLIGNDIQEKFIAGIAKEMNYTIPTDADGARAETFDETISKGIIAWFSGLCEKNGILSAKGLETLRAYDLRTEDIYAHVKNFVALVQSDNQVKIDTYFRFICDNYIRTALKVMFGFAPAAAEAVTDDALVAEFNAAYADTAYLAEISGGKVYYQAADKAYYEVTLAADGAVTEVKSLVWENSMNINFEPPVVGVYTGAVDTADKVINGYDCDLVREYRPSEDYIFEIYSPYGEALSAAGVEPAGATAPDIYKDIMVEANKVEMRDLVGVNVTGVDPEVNTVITFEQLKAIAEEKALEAANMAASQMGATVNSVNLTLSYTGYATDDEFITDVTAAANASLTFMGMTINQDVTSFMTNPVATVVLDNLSGGLDVDGALELMNAIDSDFVVDTGILDFAGNYDDYNGAIGQMNRVLCSAVEMLTTDDAYASLALTEGGNDNLTANIQKICDKFSAAFEQAKSFMGEEGFASFVEASGVNNLFASSHGFNAAMVYNLDFSDVESLYVCLIEMVLDFVDKEEAGTLVNDIHNAVEGLETLDAMAVALTDYALAKYIPTVNEKFAAQGLALTVPAATDAASVADGGAKDIIMTKLVDVAYDAAAWLVGVLNDTINKAIDTLNTNTGLDIVDVSFAFGVEKGDTWEATLTAMVDRVYELANGIIIVCGTYEGTDVFDRISAVVNAILPMGSMFSNCAGNGFVCDLNTILNTYVFGEALEGNFDNFLRLFETAEKTDDVAKDVPATYALIKASDHIVDAIFPDTVQAETYTASLTVQEEFTSGDSDVRIAANNMRSINARRTHLVPAGLDLIRESGALYYFALCEHEDASKIVDVAAVEATCTIEGVTAGKQCTVCGAIVSGCENIGIDADNHKTVQEVAAVEATCVKAGATAGKKCLDCGKVYEGCEALELDPTNHKNIQDVAAVEATCVKAGATAGKKCADCGVVCEGCEAIAPNADNHKNTTAIAAKAATCTEDGNTAGVYCNDCKNVISGNETIKATGHSFGEWTVAATPTCEENGSEQRVCAGCGSVETKEISATGHVDSDDNGKCDTCQKQLREESFIQKIVSFFRRIIDWFKKLFNVG